MDKKRKRLISIITLIFIVIIWIWIAIVARTPSIIIYAVGGNAVGKESYIKALLVMVIFAIVTLAGAFIYKNILALIHRRQEIKK